MGSEQALPIIVGASVAVGLTSFSSLPAVSSVSLALAAGAITYVSVNNNKKVEEEEERGPSKKKLRKIKKGKVKKVEQERVEPELEEPEEDEETPKMSKGQKRRAVAARAKKRAEEERIAAEKKAKEEAEKAAAAAAEEGGASKNKKKKNKKKKKQQEEAARAAAAAQAAAAAAAAQVPAPRSVPEPEPELEFDSDEGDWQAAISNRDAKLNARYAERQHARAVGPQEIKEVVPSSAIGSLIGPKGSTLEAIEESTNVKIDIPKERGSAATTIVTLVGLRADLSKAQKAIQEVVELGYSTITHPDRVTRELVVESRNRGRLVGGGFKNILKVEEVTNTKIKVPAREDDDDVVKVMGSPDDCRRAIAIMQKLMEDGFSSTTHPTWIKAEVDFPTAMLHRLIGAKGANLNAMQKSTKTKINIPRKNGEDTVMTSVEIIGDTEDVMRARTKMDEIMVRAMAEAQEDEPVTKKEWGGEGDDLLSQFEW